MKKTCILLVMVLLVSGFSKPKPKILIIGDSISIGYFPYVKEALSNVAILEHNPGNGKYTRNGLTKIHQWLGNEQWDVIQFNWGLWDLAYRQPTAKNKLALNKTDGRVTATPAEYARNLDSLVQILKDTHARLIFVTTSYVPEKEPGRYSKDVKRYNDIAKRIMKANGVAINDVYAKSKMIHKKYGRGDRNVHYTKVGYQRLAEYITGFLKKELRTVN
ncbi:MAG TPA: SGNH/GDSL hydrolase family protein [Chitinophagaceae bacterium]|nr:SGNH/GDSL hydrolase family protein [Chitinophagaceae bacterium]